MNKYLILEEALDNSVNITQHSNNWVRFTCILQEANKPNRNGRIYTKTSIDNALKSPLIQEKLRTHSWYMETGHPKTQDLMRQRDVDLRNVCAIIEDYWWDGDLLKAHCQTADTYCGRDMMGLIKQGSKISVSMRGTGAVHEDPRTGLKIVDENLNIVCYDWVWCPSHNLAYMESICEATQNFMFNYNAYSSKNIALCESLDLYENGAILELETPTVKNVDYVSNYYKRYKKLDESYTYNPSDEIVSLTENKLAMNLHNEQEFTNKKVMVEDYVVKSTRSQLNSIYENCEKPAVAEKVNAEMSEDPKTELSDETSDVKSEEKIVDIPVPTDTPASLTDPEISELINDVNLEG